MARSCYAIISGSWTFSTTPPLTTLTVTFDEQEFSEGRETQELAGHFHADHHEVRVTRGEFVRELPNIFAAMDQPTNDGVNTYFVSRAARQAGLTVVLSGLGGVNVARMGEQLKNVPRGGSVWTFALMPE